MQISEQIWRLVYVLLAIIGIGGTVVTAIYSTKTLKGALDGAFRRAESTIQNGFRETHEINMENTIIMALGPKGNDSAWSSFLKRAVEEAVDDHYLRTTGTGFVTTSTGEKLLSADIQERIRDVVKQNQEATFEELASAAVKNLGVRRLSGLAKGHAISINKMIAIVAGFAERIRTKA